MARFIDFHEGDTLISQGAEDTAAYLIQSGWVQVNRRRRNGAVASSTIGPG